MKIFALCGLIISLTMGLTAYSFAESAGKLTLKVGDERYVCNCGETCCQPISQKEGICGCGQKLVKAKVTKVGSGLATFKAADWEKERTFKTAGK